MSAESIRSHWRKLVDSFRDATKDQMCPEYREHEDRHRNHRYYR